MSHYHTVTGCKLVQFIHFDTFWYVWYFDVLWVPSHDIPSGPSRRQCPDVWHELHRLHGFPKPCIWKLIKGINVETNGALENGRILVSEMEIWCKLLAWLVDIEWTCQFNMTPDVAISQPFYTIHGMMHLNNPPPKLPMPEGPSPRCCAGHANPVS